MMARASLGSKPIVSKRRLCSAARILSWITNEVMLTGSATCTASADGLKVDDSSISDCFGESVAEQARWRLETRTRFAVQHTARRLRSGNSGEGVSYCSRSSHPQL